MDRGRPGAVYCEQAYAQGKRLDHSQGYGKLPRRIRPSDVDFGFDNSGQLLLCELSSSKRRWDELDFGQRIFYESFVKRGKVMAALCRHDVPPDRQIDTYADVQEFQVMFLNNSKLEISDVLEGSRWGKFVVAWFKDSTKVIHALQPIESLRNVVQPSRNHPDPSNPSLPTADEIKDVMDYQPPYFHRH